MSGRPCLGSASLGFDPSVAYLAVRPARVAVHYHGEVLGQPARRSRRLLVYMRLHAPARRSARADARRRRKRAHEVASGVQHQPHQDGETCGVGGAKMGEIVLLFKSPPLTPPHSGIVSHFILFSDLIAACTRPPPPGAPLHPSVVSETPHHFPPPPLVRSQATDAAEESGTEGRGGLRGERRGLQRQWCQSGPVGGQDRRDGARRRWTCVLPRAVGHRR